MYKVFLNFMFVLRKICELPPPIDKTYKSPKNDQKFQISHRRNKKSFN